MLWQVSERPQDDKKPDDAVVEMAKKVQGKARNPEHVRQLVTLKEGELTLVEEHWASKWDFNPFLYKF